MNDFIHIVIVDFNSKFFLSIIRTFFWKIYLYIPHPWTYFCNFTWLFLSIAGRVVHGMLHAFFSFVLNFLEEF